MPSKKSPVVAKKKSLNIEVKKSKTKDNTLTIKSSTENSMDMITIPEMQKPKRFDNNIPEDGGVQSIGGVNEKIEGFYRLCKDEGLTGKQGVIIPRTNVNNLMLADDVIEAVKNNQFAIYAVEDIDQALELLMGESAGVLSKTGRFPRKSIHGLVLNKLSLFSDLLNGPDE